MHRYQMILRATSLFLIVGLCGMLGCDISSTVAVPVLVGESASRAETLLVEAGLLVGTVTEEHHATMPQGYVYHQEPYYGIAVVPGTAVNIFISKGQLLLEMPDVVGMTRSAAQTEVTNQGFTVSSVVEQYHDTAPALEVIGQHPAAGAQISLTTPVTLIVSLGTPPLGPTTSFSLNEDSGAAPLIVQFEDTSHPGQGTIDSWSWDFGDAASGAANTSNLQNPHHVYNQSGVYTVTLTVGNEYDSDSDTEQVIVTVGSGVTLHPSVKVIDDIATLGYLTNNPTQFTFAYTGEGTPPLAVGDILAGSDGAGYLVQVSALKSLQLIKDGTQQLTVTVEPCSLAEAVETGSLTLDAPIQFSAAETTLDLADTVFYEDTDARFAVESGGIDYAPEVSIEVDFASHTLAELEVVAEGTLNTDFIFAVSVDDAALFQVENVPFITVLSPVDHAFTGHIGPLPVKGTVSLSMEAGLQHFASDGTETTFGVESDNLVRLDGLFRANQPVLLTNSASMPTAGDVIGIYWDDVSATQVTPIFQPQLEISFYAKKAVTLDALEAIAYTMDTQVSPSTVTILHDWSMEMLFWPHALDDTWSDNPLNTDKTSFTGTLFEWEDLSHLTDLSVTPIQVQLSEDVLEATVTVSNAGDGDLRWRAETDDANILITPDTYTGNERSVVISAVDYSVPATSTVTFINEDKPDDTQSITVQIISVIPPIEMGEMISVPTGSFTMGDPWGEGNEDETPLHTVTLSPYSIGKFEVTNEDYCAVLNWALASGLLEDINGDLYTGEGDIYAYDQLIIRPAGCMMIVFSTDRFTVPNNTGYSMKEHPVTLVTWYGAAVYCNWLSENHGLNPAYNTDTWALNDGNAGIPGLQYTNGYRLPTEAEWERAAAWDAGEERHWRYGFQSDTTDPSQGNMNDNPLDMELMGCLFYTGTPVGYFDGVNGGTVNSLSPVGCYDMSGNAFEWCHNWYAADYTEDPVTDPIGPVSGTQRVKRGGSFMSPTILNDLFRTAERGPTVPTALSTDIGFRIVQSD